MGVIVPAVLPSSRKDLDEKLRLLESLPSVSRVQIDIVDGTFATPSSWPYNAIEEFRGTTDEKKMLLHPDRLVYEMDLMCLDAEEMARVWLRLGATRLTFHAESTPDISRLLASAREHYGEGAHFASRLISFGLALNIESDIALIEQNLNDIDYVQLMGIAHIGKQGQPFDDRVFEKIRLFHGRYPNIPLQVDGGVSLESGKKLLALGVSDLIVGSALLRAADPAAVLAEFESLESPYGV